MFKIYYPQIDNEVIEPFFFFIITMLVLDFLLIISFTDALHWSKVGGDSISIKDSGLLNSYKIGDDSLIVSMVDNTLEKKKLSGKTALYHISVTLVLDWVTISQLECQTL